MQLQSHKRYIKDVVSQSNYFSRNCSQNQVWSKTKP
uniref:Uncharacterized protein n=1 Tax=Rhizophora mucronata TaxID=61149 RepID=A0A2P2NY06_RHIMU